MPVEKWGSRPPWPHDSVQLLLNSGHPLWTGHVLTSSPHSLLPQTLICETRTLVLTGPAMETGQSEGR